MRRNLTPDLSPGRAQREIPPHRFALGRNDTFQKLAKK